jgi:Holliday junction resolvasome RuvABC endonuclease subunit
MRSSILSIDPGTRYWGVSVFHGEELVVCMIKNLSAKDSSRNRLREVGKIFSNLCECYASDILVIRKPCDFWKDQSAELANIFCEIKRICKKKHIKVIEFSPRTVRKVICQDERATQRHLIEAISTHYPELKECLNHGQKHKNKYWSRIINSIAIGICYMQNNKNH